MDNPIFITDASDEKPRERIVSDVGNEKSYDVTLAYDEKKLKDPQTKERAVWSNSVEFVMSCIALSVGLGNVWRFPFVALENGGGAFVIPYLICLIFIGKPSYYMEMAIGQFSSGNSIRVFNSVPVLKGVGMGQVMATAFVMTYYSSIMATTLSYLIDSFYPTLPWSYCRPEWDPCIPSDPSLGVNITRSNLTRSSAEFYYINDVIRALPNILEGGIGTPIWPLVGYLVLSWVIIGGVVMKGVKTSGKASYFLAIFPYVVMLILLGKALTLPGSLDGIIYFFTPQWDKILLPSVWMAAVTQMFFSLSVYFGIIAAYASYNKFDNNVQRDANIVTSLDTVASMLSGCTIFAIIGHLAHELGVQDISEVVMSGPGLAFISYPDAISKFQNIPQLYGVLFFFMLFILGLGSMVAIVSCLTTIIKDHFTKFKGWQVVIVFSVFGCLTGIPYLTPGGQSLLRLVDFYGASFVVLILALVQLIAYCYIYGVPRFRRDIKFMLGFLPNWFWTVCWWAITPGLICLIVIATFVTFELETDGDHYAFPTWAHVFGWCLSASAFIQVPIFAIHRIRTRPGTTLLEKIKLSFAPAERWGPRDEETFQRYKESLNR